MADASQLSTSGLTAGYGTVQVLRDANVSVTVGECVAVLGANGAGKSTLVRAVTGFARIFEGSIMVDGIDVTSLKPFERVRFGIVQVPEGRHLFPSLSVKENLQVTLHWRRRQGVSEEELLARAFEFFPRLYERQQQRVGSMSGGEQQMLAIARAILLEPRYILLDEPSTGLAPVLVDAVFDALSRLKDLGSMGLLVVEQNPSILEIADRAYVMRSGRIIEEGRADSVAVSGILGRAYVGSIKTQARREIALDEAVHPNSGNKPVQGQSGKEEDI